MEVPPIPVRPHQGASVRILAEQWPQLDAICRATYFPTRHWGLVDAEGRCPAGYILSGAVAAAELYQAKHSHRPLGNGQLDKALAAEVSYHWFRQRKFHRPEAALFKCFQNLVVERPERIWTA